MMIAQWCCSQVKPAKAHGFHVVVSLVELFPSTSPANIQEIIAIVFVGISTAIQMYQLAATPYWKFRPSAQMTSRHKPQQTILGKIHPTDPMYLVLTRKEQ